MTLLMLLFNTTNHKTVALAYTLASILGLIVGLCASVVMRFELMSSGICILASGASYNAAITLHGLIMVFGFIMPSLYGGLANLLLPILVASPEVAYPRTNGISGVLMLAAIALLPAMLCLTELWGAGWTLYPPLSSTGMTSGGSVFIVIIVIMGISSTLASANFISTVALLAGNKTAAAIPPYIYGIVATAILLLSVLPVLTTAGVLLLLDSSYATSFFEHTTGGDVLLFEHLFWVFGHPEVYIIILPGFAVVSSCLSEINATHLPAKQSLVLAILGICGVGLVVWGHHMYIVGLDLGTLLWFAIFSWLIGVVTYAKLVVWLTALNMRN